ncbi:MAG TPA: radical SAM protein [Candidatus Hydrogenedentes bacterium]|nr:radical SAM protein [Candidatus Hydrogenedentota bacterium]
MIPDADTPLRRLLLWQRGETPGPWSITLMPTDRCNLRCAMCWQRQYEIDPARELSEERLERLVDEAAALGVIQWNISGGGEPLCRGDFLLRLCRLVRARGMDGVLQTNATMLKDAHIVTLADIGWARIVASVDGPSAEINDAIRSPGSFDQATAALRRLAAIKRERNSPLPAVTWHTVITNTNIGMLDAMAALAHELGCDAFEASSLTGDTETCRRLRGGLEAREQVEPPIRRAIARAEALGIKHNLDTILPESVSPIVPRDNRAPRSPRDLSCAVCFEPWLGITINTDGRAQPCCLYWSEDAESIQNHSLEEVWTGPFMRRMRDQLAKGIALPPCRQCLSPMLARNEAFRERLLLAQANGRQRIAAYARKAASSLRRHGWRRALQRAREWMRIGREW